MALFRPSRGRARLVLTSDKLLSSGNFFIPWDAAEEDDLSGWSAGVPHEYVVQRTGWYAIAGAVRRGVATIASFLEVRIVINGSFDDVARAPTTALDITGNVSTHKLLEQGDVVALFASFPVAPASATLRELGTTFSLSRSGPLRWT